MSTKQTVLKVGVISVVAGVGVMAFTASNVFAEPRIDNSPVVAFESPGGGSGKEAAAKKAKEAAAAKKAKEAAAAKKAKEAAAAKKAKEAAGKKKAEEDRRAADEKKHNDRKAGAEKQKNGSSSEDMKIIYDNGSQKCGEANTSILTNSNLCKSNKNGGVVISILIWIIRVMSIGVGLAAVGGVIYAALLYTSAAGSSEQTKKAIQMFINITIGLLMWGLMVGLLNFIIPGGVFK